MRSVYIFVFLFFAHSFIAMTHQYAATSLAMVVEALLN